MKHIPNKYTFGSSTGMESAREMRLNIIIFAVAFCSFPLFLSYGFKPISISICWRIIMLPVRLHTISIHYSILCLQISHRHTHTKLSCLFFVLLTLCSHLPELLVLWFLLLLVFSMAQFVEFEMPTTTIATVLHQFRLGNRNVTLLPVTISIYVLWHQHSTVYIFTFMTMIFWALSLLFFFRWWEKTALCEAQPSSKFIRRERHPRFYEKIIMTRACVYMCVRAHDIITSYDKWIVSLSLSMCSQFCFIDIDKMAQALHAVTPNGWLHIHTHYANINLIINLISFGVIDVVQI